MSRFAELKAQLEAQTEEAPAAPSSDSRFDELAVQVGIPTTAQRAEEQAQATQEAISGDPSLMDRLGHSWDKRVSNMTDTIAGLTGLESEQAALTGDTNPDRWDLDPLSAGVQTVGNAAGMVWDAAGDAVVEGVSEVWEFLPESTQEATKEQLAQLLETPLGKGALDAWSAGEESWTAFENKHPQIAKTVAQGLNLFGTGLGKMWTGKVGAQAHKAFVPYRQQRVGMRNELMPAAGRDGDIFNIIAPPHTGKQAVESAASGQVTSGPLSVVHNQRVIPTKHQWDVVDEVKKTGVSPNYTMQHNTNIVKAKIDKLNKATQSAVRKKKGTVDPEVVVNKAREALANAQNGNPAIFGLKGKKGKNTTQDLMAQWSHFVNKHGTSYEGLLKARQNWDTYMLEKIKTGTFTGNKASVATEVHKAGRDALNGIIKEGVPSTAPLLDSQWKLFTALDGMAPKAATEAGSAWARYIQRVKSHLPSTAYSMFINIPFIPLAGAYEGVASIAATTYGLMTKNKLVGNTRTHVINTLRQALNSGKDISKRISGDDLKQHLKDMTILQTVLNSMEEATTDDYEPTD